MRSLEQFIQTSEQFLVTECFSNLFIEENLEDDFFSFRAIAASAPVSQFDAPCDAFGRIVTSDYTAQGKFCSDTIRLSWAAIDNVTAGLTGI